MNLPRGFSITSSSVLQRKTLVVIGNQQRILGSEECNFLIQHEVRSHAGFVHIFAYLFLSIVSSFVQTNTSISRIGFITEITEPND